MIPTPRKLLRKIVPGTKNVTRGKDFVKEAYRKLSSEKFKVTPARLRQKIRSAYKKGDIGKGKLGKAKRGAGVNSFPGNVNNSKSGYSKGTPGLFVQSIKGMQGIHFIEKAMEQTVLEMKSD